MELSTPSRFNDICVCVIYECTMYTYRYMYIVIYVYSAVYIYVYSIWLLTNFTVAEDAYDATLNIKYQTELHTYHALTVCVRDLYVWVFLPAYVCTPHADMPSVYRSQKRGADPLEMELQRTVLSYHTQVLRTEPRSSGRVPSALNLWIIISTS